MPRVLVTGSSGFVGARVVAALGSDAVACDTRVNVPVSAMANAARLRALEIDTIVHCAAVQLFTPGVDLYDPRTFELGNVTPITQLLAAARGAGVRKVVHVSTDMVYGHARGRPFVESDPYAPVGHYGRSKVEAERVVERARDGIEVVTVVRPCIIAGRGRGGVFAQLERLVRAGLPVPLFGDGRNAMQLVHVDDVTELLLEAVRRDVPGTFHAASREATTVRAKIEQIARAVGKPARVVSVPERVLVRACAAAHAVHAGALHPEQYELAGEARTLSLAHTEGHFAWRPRYGDADVVDAMVG